jgi:ketosteroid isomerase-like protein
LDQVSKENVETVHRVYAASRLRDKEACVREAAADVEIVSYLMGVEGTVYRGHAGLGRYIDDLFSAFPDWHPTVLRTTDYGDRVLAEVRMAGQGASSGLAIEQTVWQVTTFNDEGRMIGFHGYGTPAEAFEAVGVAEPS